MTWNLVEALTGLQTGDDWNNNGYVVARFRAVALVEVYSQLISSSQQHFSLLQTIADEENI